MFLAENLDIKGIINSSSLQILIISLISMGACQVVKFVIYSIIAKRPLWMLLWSTGGLPSSHTSFCIALCVSLGMFQWHDMGYIDYSFAVAVVLSAIVIHDAMGVRLEASKHAKILNNLVSDKSEEERKELGFGKKGELKEMLGHKATEVLAGAAVGLVVGFVGFWICT